MNIKCLDKFGPLLEKKKRIKIVVGGRGSTKSTFVSDVVISSIMSGNIWACGREFQVSINESVHRLLQDEILRNDLPGFNFSKTEIEHESGGRTFYIGLARNINNLKSMLSGIKGLWIEEGETLSERTLTVAMPSVRTTLKDTQKYLDAGVDEEKLLSSIDVPEIWITMNRGRSNDPVAERFLKHAESDLQRTGFYEDESMMIIEANYTDMPREWFIASGLEAERVLDEKRLSAAEYAHKWLGQYGDSVEDAIIQTDWFDAAVDAHKKLGFEPRGAKILGHDVADSGDARTYAIRHGSVIIDADENLEMDVNDACDWALNKAINERVDWFAWDSDGMGMSLRKHIDATLVGTRISWVAFMGGSVPENPHASYVSGWTSTSSSSTEKSNISTNREMFKNRKAQFYWRLRDNFYRTYRAVTLGEYYAPEDLISISSEIKCLSKVRAEVCSVPRKYNRNGLLQIMSKDEMQRKNIPSQNIADAIMMVMFTPDASGAGMKRRVARPAPVSLDGWT